MSQVGVLSKRLDGSSWFLAWMEASFHLESGAVHHIHGLKKNELILMINGR